VIRYFQGMLIFFEQIDDAVFGALDQLDRKTGRFWHIIWHGASKGLVKKRTGNNFRDFLNWVTYDIFCRLDRLDTKFFFQGKIYQTPICRVRSKAEKTIATWLYRHGIEFEYEKRLKLSSDVFLPDFYLTKHGVYLECWGLADENRRYDAHRRNKMRAYRAHGIKLISIYPRHLNRLDDEIPKQFLALTGRNI